VFFWFENYKNQLNWVCNCGESDIVCMDFHHRNPDEKDSTIGKMVNDGFGIEAILAEISKCDILCSNCHRKLHYKIKNSNL
jgi:hypothetical protein